VTFNIFVLNLTNGHAFLKNIVANSTIGAGAAQHRVIVRVEDFWMKLDASIYFRNDSCQRVMRRAVSC